jgi:hypothetical protein
MPMPRTRHVLRIAAAVLGLAVAGWLAACAPVAPAAPVAPVASAAPIAPAASGAPVPRAAPSAVPAPTELAATGPSPAIAAGAPVQDAALGSTQVARQAAPAPQPAQGGDRCVSDADCAVKDVGSCCGYNPRCVATSSTPDPAAARAHCAAEGRVGNCGFREPAGCQCTQGHCSAVAAPAVEIVR